MHRPKPVKKPLLSEEERTLLASFQSSRLYASLGNEVEYINADDRAMTLTHHQVGLIDARVSVKNGVEIGGGYTTASAR